MISWCTHSSHFTFHTGIALSTNVCNLCVKVDRFCGRRFSVKLKNLVWL
jgi:hypothetical protein